MSFVLTETRGCLGLITLNRPQALNALNLEMVQAIAAALVQFSGDAAVTAIALVSASDKAFCAGGDVRAAVTIGRSDPQAAAQFFRAEYLLNHHIASCSKPLYAFVDGICFGGGMGLAIHARHCLATPRASFAMPEMRIGLFPDVGAAHFLNRHSLAVGNWVALTGVRLSAAEALACQLVENVIAPEAIAPALAALAAGQLPTWPAAAPAPLPEEAIARCFSLLSPVAVMQQLEKEGDAWAETQLAALREGSPTSQAVALRHLRESRGQSLERVLNIDLRLASAFLHFPDFYEGVRARLIDKDNAPHWQPAAPLAPFWAVPPGGDLFP